MNRRRINKAFKRISRLTANKELEEIVDYIKTKNRGIIISVSTNAVVPDFIRESNRIGFIVFCDNVSSALKRFENSNI